MTHFGFEILYGIGAALLLLGLVWGVVQYARRNRANDPLTEEATRSLYDRPETGAAERERLRAEAERASKA